LGVSLSPPFVGDCDPFSLGNSSGGNPPGLAGNVGRSGKTIGKSVFLGCTGGEAALSVPPVGRTCSVFVGSACGFVVEDPIPVVGAGLEGDGGTSVLVVLLGTTTGGGSGLGDVIFGLVSAFAGGME
jgi:hypothetical protein